MSLLLSDVYEAILQHLSPSDIFSVLTTNRTLGYEARRCLYTYIDLPLTSPKDSAHHLEKMTYQAALTWLHPHERIRYRAAHPEPGPDPSLLRTKKLIHALHSEEGREWGKLVQSLNIGARFPDWLVSELMGILNGRVPNLRSLGLLNSSITASSFIEQLKSSDAASVSLGVATPSPHPQHSLPKLQRLLCEFPIDNDFFHLLHLLSPSLSELRWFLPRQQRDPSISLATSPLPKLTAVELSPHALNYLHLLPVHPLQNLRCSIPPFKVESLRLNAQGGGEISSLRALSITDYLDVDTLLQIPLYYRRLRYLQLTVDSFELDPIPASILQIASSKSLPHLTALAIDAQGAKKIIFKGERGDNAFVQRLFVANEALMYVQLARTRWRRGYILGREGLWDSEKEWRRGW